ncbi:MAG: hypothetical protein E7056_08895 [Lentisphaerae bacterium]|nr:hypothetical protein [Lentisphaerota bacterium]
MAVVYVDVIPPVKPTAKASTTAVTNKNVTVTATFSSDSKVKQYSLDNKNWKTYTGAVVMAKNGTVYFRAADAAGNYSQVTGYTVKNIDKTAPAKPTAKASTTATTDKSVTITANFSSDSKVKQYSLDNKNWKTYTGAVAMAKNGTVYFRAADAAGNYSQVTSYTVKNIIKAEPDKVAPKAGKVTATQKAQDSVLLTFNGFSDNKGIARYDILLNGKKIGSTTAKSFTYNGKNLAGNLQFVVRAYDAAGNAAKDAKAKVKIIDKTAPEKVTGLNVKGTATEKTATLTWNKPKDNVGVVSYEIQVSGVSKVFKSKTNSLVVKKLSAGTHTFTVYAIDKAKNKSVVSAKKSFTVLDGTAPKAGKVTATQTAQDSVLLTFNGFSDNKGIARYDILLNGKKIGSTTAKSFTYNGKNLAGNLQFAVRAYDAAGNAAKDAKAKVKIIDKTAPEKVTGLNVKGTATEKTATLTWNKPKDNVGVVSYEIQVSGVSKVFKSKTNSLVVKKLSAGTHTFTVYAIDKAKNKSVVSAKKSFTVLDGTAPKAGKVTATQKAQDSVLLTFNGFSDNKGIDHYDIWLNNKKVGTTNAKSFTYNGKNLAGNLQFVVRAYDAAGNAAKDAKAKVKIQAMAPQAKTLAFSGPEVAEAEYLAMPETPAATEYTAPQELSLADFSLPEPSLLTGSEALCADSCAASLDTTTENILDNKNKGMLA